MSIETNVQAPTEQVQSPAGNEQQPTVVRDPEAVLLKNSELLAEITKEKAKRKELEEKIAKEEQERLEKQGEYKEIVEKQKIEIEKLKSVEEKASKYDTYFESQLKEIIKDLPDVHKKLIEGYNGTLDEKVTYANQVKASLNMKVDGIGSERPGGQGMIITMEDVDKEPDMKKKAELLFRMKASKN